MIKLDVFENELNELIDAIKFIGQEDYVQKCPVIFGSSVGQHCRHIIELFDILLNEYESGNINYDNRKRNELIEKDLDLAVASITQIKLALNKPDKKLTVTDPFLSESLIQTSFYRELIYNLEHTIHHAAIIKIAANHLQKNIPSEKFGLAPSTIKYKEQCAQ